MSNTVASTLLCLLWPFANLPIAGFLTLAGLLIGWKSSTPIRAVLLAAFSMAFIESGWFLTFDPTSTFFETFFADGTPSYTFIFALFLFGNAILLVAGVAACRLLRRLISDSEPTGTVSPHRATRHMVFTFTPVAWIIATVIAIHLAYALPIVEIRPYCMDRRVSSQNQLADAQPTKAFWTAFQYGWRIAYFDEPSLPAMFVRYRQATENDYVDYAVNFSWRAAATVFGDVRPEQRPADWPKTFEGRNCADVRRIGFSGRRSNL